MRCTNSGIDDVNTQTRFMVLFTLGSLLTWGKPLDASSGISPRYLSTMVSPREPEWIEELTAEVLSSLVDHLGQKGVNHHRQWRNLVWPTSGLQGANPQEGEEGHLHRKGPHWGEGSPLEGPGYCDCPWGRNRVAEPVHYQGLVGGPYPLQKPGSPQMEI